ncbi:MAG: WecB/TagA/CpsF family glycosyltransferase [Leptospiraceae bacterium]|nr:WecB/TagA/CpsF family glycosyltransferase [Leptospiraceae bacterium]MCP5512230.1 WecB/TagA/CpsF family glycosyltransferase [Leptospiraceae bacterium]
MKDQFQIIHQSAKEERDYVLEYQNIDVNLRPKINLSGVEIDNISRDRAVAIIIDWVKKKEKFHHVLFLDPIKLMEMREGKSLNRIPKKSSMVLAEAGGMDWAAECTGEKLEETISIISLMMDIIRFSEKQSLTLFFLGSKEKVIERLFFNLIKHFPEIRIVGRHSGYLTKERELMVKEAIRKTGPDIIFLGMDFPDQELWIENNTGYFGKSVVIGTWRTFDILSGNLDKVPDFFQRKELHWLWKIITKPWRLKKVWIAIRFYFHFRWKRMKSKQQASP